VRVQIGPVSATSVTAWVGYARKALDETVDAPGGDGVWLPDDTVATFVHYLDEWEKAAAGVDVVHATQQPHDWSSRPGQNERRCSENSSLPWPSSFSAVRNEVTRAR